MPKKPRVRTLMNSRHVKESETLHKSTQQYFCQIFWSLWKKISSKNFFLVLSEILRLSCKHIDTRWQVFSLSRSECFTQPIEMQLSPNQKIFSEFFSAFPESALKFRILWEKDNPQRLFVSEIKERKNTGY